MSFTDSKLVRTVKMAPMFSSLEDGAIESLLRGCFQRGFKAGQLILRAGGPADKFFLILSGRVKVFKVSVQGEEQILHLYDRGQSFGEAAMWAKASFPAHAEAVTAVSVLVVPRGAFRRAISENVDLAMGMLASMAGKLKEFNKLIEELSLKEVPARLAGALLAESRKAGTRTIRLGQTKRQLASQIGTVPETLSRALAKLKAAGVIQVDGPKITILDLEALEDLDGQG